MFGGETVLRRDDSKISGFGYSFEEFIAPVAVSKDMSTAMDVIEDTIRFEGRWWDEPTFYLTITVSRLDLDITAIRGTIGWCWPGGFPFELQTTKLSCSDLSGMVSR
jgi:hypothetical protein